MTFPSSRFSRIAASFAGTPSAPAAAAAPAPARRAPVALSPQQLAQVAGGSPKGGWVTTSELVIQSPKGGWA